ncbi:Kinesin-like protein [Rhynchospora pubera]|uniref:Kinesin-like protein n=1 Tax=Rhynchospora pubera TaxID=906938 RepID=A0AAV8D4G9_9POAL|nr:Kinesin-like protein [Rhynchospora pubera]
MKSLFNSKTLTPNSQKNKPPKVPKENLDPNSVPSDSSPYKSPGFSKLFSGKSRSPLPPRPPLKRKLSSEILEGAATIPTASDSGVQVIVRIRPPSKDEEEEGSVVQKLTGNSVSISDHTFTFDSVADTVSTQEDVFHLVGLPLVENCLAGFNSSIFAYGQTGSGKTYTMWGPPTALSDENSLSNERGLTPRVFERLFSRINEIYNEQITDLLDPTQRNLQIREDVGTGVYVESLTEEFVYTLKDVNQLLMKNVEDGLNAARMSRINLVDLAGSERQKHTKAAGDRLKEAGNINKSLSQLGNLINILGEVSQSGKQRHIPYRDSKLTFLLQESLGGNAKLAMICAVSPSVRCKSESLSTLRFAQRAKAIKNKAVVNETTQDDVNMLREQVRLLRDELVRIKSNRGATMGDGYSTAEHARRTVNLLRMSLTCTTAMPFIRMTVMKRWRLMKMM